MKNFAENFGLKSEFSAAQKLRLAFLAIILGIFSGQWIFYPQFLLLAGIIFLVLNFWRKNLALVIFAIFLLSNFYGQFRQLASFEKEVLPHRTEQKINLVGVVNSFPDIRQKTTRVFVETEYLSAENENKQQKIREKFLLILPNPVKIDYGNKIFAQGKLNTPRNYNSDFDYRSYLKRFGVQTILKNPEKFKILAENQGNFWLHLAKKSRNFLEKNLTKSLPSPHHKIALGVLLGVKNELPSWTQADFKNSGLMHLLVVSGTNVTIILIAINFLLKKFGRRISFLFSLLALIFFVLMTGADAPILRAGIMGGLAGLAVSWGKSVEIRNIILFSAVIMGVLNPFILQTDIGFFLSFGATLGIIIGVPIFQKYIIQPAPQNFRGILTILSVSLSAQITILPVLIKYFKSFPLGGIPANLFTEPLMPFIMFFSFISSLAGTFSQNFAKIIAIPAYTLIEILLQIARFFSQIPVLEIPQWLNIIIGSIIILILLYGLFSRDFEEKFLVKESIK